MRPYDWFNGAADWTACRVSGAEPAAFLNRCAAAGVPLLSAAAAGAFALEVRLRTGDLERAADLARRSQCTLEPLGGGGAGHAGRHLLRRAAVTAGLLLAAALLLWSRLYIWEIGVSGNETVPAGEILDALAECGVGIGSFWPGITSDSLRSELLVRLPALSWATVNLYGSRAEVIVRERVPKPAIRDPAAAVDVTAAKAGFVRRVYALEGTARVRPGFAAAAGDVLISHSADSAYGGPRSVHAAGSVTAETYYELTAAVPLTEQAKTYTGRVRRSLALEVGKNRYNFFGNSSISPAGCDTITAVWDCALGGVFSLPVRLVRETDRAYVLTERPRDLSAARRALEAALYRRLLASLAPGGTVEAAGYTAAEGGGLLTVCLRARCLEDIAAETPADGY